MTKAELIKKLKDARTVLFELRDYAIELYYYDMDKLYEVGDAVDDVIKQIEKEESKCSE